MWGDDSENQVFYSAPQNKEQSALGLNGFYNTLSSSHTKKIGILVGIILEYHCLPFLEKYLPTSREDHSEISMSLTCLCGTGN